MPNYSSREKSDLVEALVGKAWYYANMRRKGAPDESQIQMLVRKLLEDKKV